jgi:hypothetical protein
MPYFDKHFTVAEARAMLPRLRRQFQELHDLQAAIRVTAARHDGAREARRGNGGGTEGSGDYAEANLRFQTILHEIAEAGIQVKDVERGLVDFPHIRDDREVLLCWQLGEATISYWHDLDSGFAGRRLLES